MYQTECEKHGHEVDRSKWRLVGPMHIAETTEQAREDIRFGLEDWLFYFQKVANLPLGADGSLEEAMDALARINAKEIEALQKGMHAEDVANGDCDG